MTIYFPPSHLITINNLVCLNEWDLETWKMDQDCQKGQWNGIKILNGIPPLGYFPTKYSVVYGCHGLWTERSI